MLPIIMWITLCNDMIFLNERSAHLIIVPFKLIAAQLIESWDSSGKTPDPEM